MMIINKIAKITYEGNKNKCNESIVEWEAALNYIFRKIIINLALVLGIFIMQKSLGLSKDIYIFFISFLLLRRVWGGFHLENEISCLILSIMVPTFCVIIFSNLNYNSIITIALFAICAIIHSIIGVVDNKNKVLSDNQKKKFAVQGLITLTILMIISLLTENRYIDLAVIVNLISSCVAKLIRDKQCSNRQ